MWRVTLFLSLVFVLGIIGIAFCPDENKTCSGKCGNCLLDGKCANSNHEKCQDSGRCKSNKTDNTAMKERADNLCGKLPLTFIQNKGQLDAQVRFCARSPKATVYFTPSEAIFHFAERKTDEKTELHKEFVLRTEFLGANPDVTIHGSEMLPGKVNVFKGNDPSKWLSNIPTYREIIYKNLWQGINLVYHGEEGYGLKYDIVIEPGADPERIRFKYRGCDSRQSTHRTNLSLRLRWVAL